MTINHVPYLFAFLFLALLFPLLAISGAFRKKMAGLLLNLCFGKPALQGIFPIRARIELTDTRGFELFVETNFVQIRERPHTPELIKGLFFRSIKRSAHPGHENLLVFNDERFEPLEELPAIESFEVLGSHRGFKISYRFVVLSQELKTALPPKEAEMTVPLLLKDPFPPDPLAFVHKVGDQSWLELEEDPGTYLDDEDDRCRLCLDPIADNGTQKVPVKTWDHQDFVGLHDESDESEQCRFYFDDHIADNEGETVLEVTKTWDHEDFEKTKKSPVVSMTNESGLLNKVMVTCPTVFRGSTAVQVAKNLRLADPNEVVQIMTDGLSELSISYEQPADDPNLEITHRRRDALPKTPEGYYWEFFRGNAEKPMEWCLLKDAHHCQEPAVNLLLLENEEAVEKGNELGLIYPENIHHMFLVNGSPTEVLYGCMGPKKDVEMMASLEDNVGGKWTYEFDEEQNIFFTQDLIRFKKVR